MGYELKAINGRDVTRDPWSDTPGEKLLACLASTESQAPWLKSITSKEFEVHFDFMDPVPQGHGMTTLADTVAKRPLLRSAVR